MIDSEVKTITFYQNLKEIYLSFISFFYKRYIISDFIKDFL